MKWGGVTESERIGGLIGTLRRGSEVTVRHFIGRQTEAVQACADYCDAGGWRVVTLSSPATIWRDLQGTRELEAVTDTALRVGGQRYGVQMPEPRLLGLVGRGDLWESPRRG